MLRKNTGVGWRRNHLRPVGDDRRIEPQDTPRLWCTVGLGKEMPEVWECRMVSFRVGNPGKSVEMVLRKYHDR